MNVRHAAEEVCHGDTSCVRGLGIEHREDLILLFCGVFGATLVGDACGVLVLLQLLHEVLELGGDQHAVTVGVRGCEGGSELTHLLGLGLFAGPSGLLFLELG